MAWESGDAFIFGQQRPGRGGKIQQQKEKKNDLLERYGD